MGRPKALLPFNGRTFLENILDIVSRSAAGPVLTVLGHNHDVIAQSVSLANVVLNPDYEQGMTTSIKAGIRALPAEAEGALLFLVDHPAIETATIDALIGNFKKGCIVLPVHNGRRGHPVLFSRDVLDEIMDLPASAGANVVVRRDASRVIEVALDDPGILIDVDTPAQFVELRRQGNETLE